MGDRRRKLLQPALTIGNFGAEQVLMSAIERFAIQVLISGVSDRHRRACQHIFDAPVETRLFLFGLAQGMFDGAQDRADARAVGVDVPIGRAGLEMPVVRSAGEEIVRASPQEKLKHRSVSGPCRGFRCPGFDIRAMLQRGLLRKSEPGTPANTKILARFWI